jgi:hypothetical protein
MIWLVGIKYKSLEWPNGLARASRQSVRVAVRIPMNTRVAILGVTFCHLCVDFRPSPWKSTWLTPGRAHHYPGWQKARKQTELKTRNGRAQRGTYSFRLPLRPP